MKQSGLPVNHVRSSPSHRPAPMRKEFPDRMELYSQGLSDRDIGKALGVSTQVIRKWRTVRNLPRIAPSYRECTAEDDAKRMELYRAGLNDCQIGRELGIRAGAVLNWRRARNLPPNQQRAGLTEEGQALRLKLWQEGKTDPEIAQALGVKAPSVCTWRNKNGYPPNKKKK